jgi:zinc protease
MLRAIGLIVLSWLLWSAHASAMVEIQTWQSEKGAKVLFVHAPELPMLDIEVVFDAGSARDGQQWGIAAMTTALVGTQTPNLNEEQISRQTNELGAKIGGGVDRDKASFALRTLTRDSILQPALALFAESLTQSEFDASIFERERQRVLVGLQQQQKNPSQLAANAFWQNLYGDHPYAHPVSGTLETVQSLTLKDVQAFYQRYFVAANATVAVVGNVRAEQARDMVDALLAAMPVGQKPSALPEPKAPERAQQTVIEFDASQTHLRQGQLGVARGDPDYYALFLGNHLLGGSGFGSLLMEEVREKRGLVYGVGSGFSPQRVTGPWLSYLSTKNDSALEAKKVVEQTIEAFMAEIDDAHFQAIKDNLIGGFALRIDSNAKILGYLSMIGFYGLPLDYLVRFPREIEALTKEDVLKAWRKRIDPDKMVTVMVGKPQSPQ